ncbi:MAG: 4-(cytidine 5'-diphospho)-2-C-methyl-D-erythritol kinase [Spirochaetes bacterium]|nr:4-(cytidine 5'-diphospho)-2-C-methyl-D-erythritol kinase [Spirochaetota bacterium]
MKPARGMIESHAKLNLHLSVLGVRPDGYHEIESLFQAISLADRIEYELEDGDGIEIHGVFDCAQADNTMAKAAREFSRVSGSRFMLRLRVEKEIPAGSGMGGGSSNAAAVLAVLNRASAHPLDVAELAAVGAAIGSDVPFFLQAAAAYVGGSGEFVHPIPARVDFSLVIVMPGFPISTREAFSVLDGARKVAGSSLLVKYGIDALSAQYRRPVAEWNFRNDFFKVLAPIHVELNRIGEALTATGASFSAMTGSGSTMFGVFNGRIDAENAVRALESSGFRAFSVSPLAKIPGLR